MSFSWLRRPLDTVYSIDIIAWQRATLCYIFKLNLYLHFFSSNIEPTQTHPSLIFISHFMSHFLNSSPQAHSAMLISSVNWVRFVACSFYSHFFYHRYIERPKMKNCEDFFSYSTRRLKNVWELSFHHESPCCQDNAHTYGCRITKLITKIYSNLCVIREFASRRKNWSKWISFFEKFSFRYMWDYVGCVQWAVPMTVIFLIKIYYS